MREQLRAEGSHLTHHAVPALILLFQSSQGCRNSTAEHTAPLCLPREKLLLLGLSHQKGRVGFTSLGMLFPAKNKN